MGIFSKIDIVNAIISGALGAALSLMSQPFVEQAQEKGSSSFDPPIIVIITPAKTPPPTGVINVGPEHVQLGFFDEDKKGSVTFEAFVLTQNFRWKYASEGEVTYPSAQPVQDIVIYLKNHLSFLLKDAQDVISIGMASCEGDRPGEEERAGKRAEQLKTWIQQARPDDKPRNYYVVNLGQYKKHDCRAGRQPGEDETSDQRRIVILYVTKTINIRDRKDLADRILRQLRANEELLFDPADYSREFVLKDGRYKR